MYFRKRYVIILSGICT